MPDRDFSVAALGYSFPDLKRVELADVEKAYRRLFATSDGKIVIDHLQRLTLWRALGPQSQDSEIRYAEGQRALVGQILRHITNGR